MRILIINTSPLEFDGITLSILTYFKMMDRTDMQVDFVSVSKSNPKVIKIIEEMNCGIHHIEMRSKDPLKYFFKLVQLIRKNKYDIVHAHGSSAILAIEMLAAKIAGCKVRISHSRNTKCDHVKADKILRPLFYATYTHGFACGIEAGKWLFAKRNFRVIKNGKELNKLAYNESVREEIREKYQWEDKIVLGHVGNFNKQKNHAFLIDTFAELVQMDSRYILVMMGKGSNKPEIEEMVMKYGLSNKCHFFGSVTNIDEMLQGMDIMLLPSLFEGLPNVVLEWQAAGLPCIISDAITTECKATELVKYMPLNAGPDKWADAIRISELQDREKQASSIMQQMVEAGFDIETNARELRNIYGELVRGFR